MVAQIESDGLVSANCPLIHIKVAHLLALDDLFGTSGRLLLHCVAMSRTLLLFDDIVRAMCVIRVILLSHQRHVDPFLVFLLASRHRALSFIIRSGFHRAYMSRMRSCHLTHWLSILLGHHWAPLQLLLQLLHFVFLGRISKRHQMG